MNIIVGLIGYSVGTVFGAWLMWLVAGRAILMVKERENTRHKELLNEVADHVGMWQDCVNDILDAIESGRLQNRSIPDQLAAVRRIVVADTVGRDKQEEKGPELINPDE